MKKKLLLLLISLQITICIHCKYNSLAGIHLPYFIRTILCTVQKKMAASTIPYHVQQAILYAQYHHEIHNDLTIRSYYKKNALSWDEFEQKIKLKPQRSFLLFAFGSLIHSQHPINQLYQPNLNIPALAFGIKRIFNMKHFNPKISPIGLPTKGYEDEQLRLSTQITNKITDYTNGILLKFSLDSPAYHDLKIREQKYFLQPIKVIDYQSLFTEPIFFDAFVLVTPYQELCISAKPHIVYTQIVLNGAHTIQQLGADGFLSLILEKTYLADKKTTLRSWIINR